MNHLIEKENLLEEKYIMGEYENTAIKAAIKLQSARENSGENNKKVLIQFVIVMIISVAAGFVAGFFFTTDNTIEPLGKLFSEAAVFLKLNIAYIALAINIVMCAIGYALFGRANTLYKKWDGEDDEVIDKVEDKLFFPMAIPAVMMVLNFLFFGIVMCSKPLGDERNSHIAFLVMLSTVVLVFSMVWEVLLQGITVSLLKKINPEKRGNILDFGFDKKWINSCDEAQKMAVYRASYETYKFSKYIFMVAWGIILVTNEIFKCGIFPIVLVSVMWLVQTVIYMVEARKYERGKSIL